MTGPAGSRLYTPRLLALSAGLAAYPLSGDFTFRGKARSRTCGSTIAVGLATDENGRVERIGVQVTACAVGQSSAAILAQGIAGKDRAAMERMLGQIDAWIAGEGDLPDWPEFDALDQARAHPGRHGALVMPWKAAVDALSSQPASG